jgi:lipid-A-disaccharide synthase
MNVAIFSGELSGDLIGGALAAELRRLSGNVEMWGLGSAAMRAAGVELIADSASWGAIGVLNSLAKIPGLALSIMPRVKAALRARRPDVVVLIDFGAFNVRVARYARTLGLKVLYYFPPGSSRRSGPPGAELAQITDRLAVPFAFAEEHYKALGANAVTVGHPMVERVRPSIGKAEFCARFGLDPNRAIVGLLPGSRRAEVRNLMPAMLESARLIYAGSPDVQFIVGVAPSISAEMVAAFLARRERLTERIRDIWRELSDEAESRFWRRVTRTTSALLSRPRRMLVTSAGVLVPEQELEREMDARRRSEQLRARAGAAIPPTVLAKELTYDVMAHSDLLLVCSGTATLEAALLGTPMVVLYRGSKWMEMEFRLRGGMRRVEHIGLPNLLAQRRIVPELIQWQATPAAIADAGLRLLNDLEARHQTREDLRAVKELLGPPGASERTARLVLDLAEQAR